VSVSDLLLSSPRVRAAAALLRLLPLLAVVWGCEQSTPEKVPPVAEVPVPDSAPIVEIAADSAISSYDPALGPLLLVPLLAADGSRDRVSVLSPLQSPDRSVDDTSGLSKRLGDGRVWLLSRAGRVGVGVVRLGVEPDSASRGSMDNTATPTVPGAAGGMCGVWPVGRLTLDVDPVAATGATVSGSGAVAGGATPVHAVAPGWLVGIPLGRAIPVPLDSIEALPSRDSSVLAATLTRLASALAEDSMSPFRGLPFTVRRAYRTRDIAAGFTLSVLVRRIPQEDRPLEERLLMVVETASANSRQWAVSWFERTIGPEEEVIASEPLAVMLRGTDLEPAVILGRDDGTGTSLALLERSGPGWRIRWESPVIGC
jgi:hypothetical protein